MASEEFIHEIQLNERSKYIFTIARLDGRRLAAVRLYYLAADGNWRPGRAGITTRTHRLARLIAGLQTLLIECRKRGLAPPADGDQ